MRTDAGQRTDRLGTTTQREESLGATTISLSQAAPSTRDHRMIVILHVVVSFVAVGCYSHVYFVVCKFFAIVQFKKNRR